MNTHLSWPAGRPLSVMIGRTKLPVTCYYETVGDFKVSVNWLEYKPPELPAQDVMSVCPVCPSPVRHSKRPPICKMNGYGCQYVKYECGTIMAFVQEGADTVLPM